MKSQTHFALGKKRFLAVFGSIFAAVGLLMLLISLMTDYWIITYERMSVMNVTNIIAQNSGLFRKCWQSHELLGVTKMTSWSDNMKIFPSGLLKNCTFISYFKGKPQNSGEMKAPETILYEMRTTAIFSVISLIVLLNGSVLSMFSFCNEKLKKSIFIASGLYVLSGILLLIGIVLYVGCISQAFDSKSDNTESENLYLYEYGISFYFSVMAFVLSEFAGVFCIYLYIAKQKHLIKSLNTELFIKTNADDKFTKALHYNHIGLESIVNNPSEVSPVSNMSQMSYQAYRRYSEQQLLLKLYPNVEISSQYSSPARTNATFNRTLNDCKLLNESISFIPEFRASKPSPIIDHIGIKKSKEKLYDPSQVIVYYNDSPLEESPSKQVPIMTNSIILNQETYFDSPLSDSFSETCKPLYSSNICNTCNLSFNLCNCACALLYVEKPIVQTSKVYSNTDSSCHLPSTIYNQNIHFNNISTFKNNNNNNSNHKNNTSVDMEKVSDENVKTSLLKSGKERKITAV